MPENLARPCQLARYGVFAVFFVNSCVGKDSAQKVMQPLRSIPARPDEAPKVLNTDLPFRYPIALYARRVQGNVTLRLFIDCDGQVRQDSTGIEESSGYPGLDSAAVRGSRELRFKPAKQRGKPLSATVLFPVFFRHPDAHALPGDTILDKANRAP